VLTATVRGQIIALDRRTGKVVRVITATGGINGWPAATDDTIVWPVSMSRPATLVAYRVVKQP
jgi:hypothetical protein